MERMGACGVKWEVDPGQPFFCLGSVTTFGRSSKIYFLFRAIGGWQSLPAASAVVISRSPGDRASGMARIFGSRKCSGVFRSYFFEIVCDRLEHLVHFRHGHRLFV
jgi:hypothetical protein